MKKLIFGAFALLCTFGFTSCKKDYNCVCKVNGATVKTTMYNDVSRAEAEDRCDGDGTALGGSITYDCDVEAD